MRLEWTVESGLDLREIKDYIAQDDPLSAARVVRDIRRAAQCWPITRCLGDLEKLPEQENWWWDACLIWLSIVSVRKTCEFWQWCIRQGFGYWGLIGPDDVGVRCRSSPI